MAGWDLDDAARALFEKHGRPPSDLWAMTPLELLFLFGKRPDAGAEIDRAGELARHNRRRAERGLPPAPTPDWHMPKVPRCPPKRAWSRS